MLGHKTDEGQKISNFKNTFFLSISLVDKKFSLQPYYEAIWLTTNEG